jgi:hypothetical protein
VYLHAGTPFDKKGDIEMTLPRMDMPVGIVQWEVFAPERYSMKPIGGNAIEMTSLRVSDGSAARAYAPSSVLIEQSVFTGAVGQIGGTVKDSSGAVLPGVTLELSSPALPERVRTAISGSNGRFAFSTLPAGPMSLTATLSGFNTARRDFSYYDQRPTELTIELRVGALEETVTVTAERPLVDTQSSAQRMVLSNDPNEQRGTWRSDKETAPIVAPSQNVVELQRRASGVLPVRVDIPRAGTSHQFVKPLVVDQETTVKLRYKRR